MNYSRVQEKDEINYIIADFMEQWTEQLQSENLLEGYRAEKFIEYRMHRWSKTFDGDGYGFHAENTRPHQGI